MASSGNADHDFALVTKTAFPGGVHYNSTRLPGSDRLDSSPLTFQFRVPASFVDGFGDASHSVCVDIVYFDGTAPKVFVEDARGTPASFAMSHIPCPRMTETTLNGNLLSVCVERKFPLSSSHGLRKFRLAFTFSPSGVVLFTEPFTVLAKKAKKGVGVKLVHKPTLLPVDAARLGRLAKLAALCPGGGAASVPVSPQPPAVLPVPCGVVDDDAKATEGAAYFDSLFDTSTLKRTVSESSMAASKRQRTAAPGDSPDTVVTSAVTDPVRLTFDDADCGRLVVAPGTGLDTSALLDLFDGPPSPALAASASPFASMLGDLPSPFDLDSVFA